MAGDWTKVEHDLRDKPEVIAVSHALRIDDRDLVVGKLIRLWQWFDKHTVDGCADSATEMFIDAHVECAGFANALKKVGWLTVKRNSISLPNFERHNSKSARRRALAALRMRCARSATEAQPEKRREEKRYKKENKSKKESLPPTLEQVKNYCVERGNEIDAQEFLDFYEANGWVQGKSRKPIRSWQACVRTWEQNRARQNGASRVPTDDDLRNYNAVDGGIGGGA